MKKIAIVSALAVLVSAFSGSATGIRGQHPETTVSADCSLIGKWQVLSMEVNGQTADVKSEKLVYEFAEGTLTASSKSQPASTDKYKREGDTIELTDEKTGEKQLMEIVKCTPEAVSLKMVADGMTIIQNLKKM